MWVWVSMSQDSPDPLHFEGFNQTARVLFMKFFFSHENIAPESVRHSLSRSNHKGISSQRKCLQVVPNSAQQKSHNISSDQIG